MPPASRAAVYSQFFPESSQISVVNLPSAHQLMNTLSAELRPALEKYDIKATATAVDLKTALISSKDVLFQTVESFMKTAKMNPGMVVQGALNGNLKEMHTTIMNMASAAKLHEDLPSLQGVSVSRTERSLHPLYNLMSY
jgi:tripartite-type tricarboxylate transporter receptor subunit TctC